MDFFLVFIGSGIGGIMRHGVGLISLRLFGTAFPVGTLFINIAGSFVMGLVAEYWALKSGLPQPARLFLTTGIIGGFTTFSAFSLDAALLWERGQPMISTIYVAASVIVSVAALFAGLWLIRQLDAGGVL